MIISARAVVSLAPGHSVIFHCKDVVLFLLCSESDLFVSNRGKGLIAEPFSRQIEGNYRRSGGLVVGPPGEVPFLVTTD